MKDEYIDCPNSTQLKNKKFIIPKTEISVKGIRRELYEWAYRNHWVLVKMEEIDAFFRERKMIFFYILRTRAIPISTEDLKERLISQDFVFQVINSAEKGIRILKLVRKEQIDLHDRIESANSEKRKAKFKFTKLDKRFKLQNAEIIKLEEILKKEKEKKKKKKEEKIAPKSDKLKEEK